MYPSNQLQTLGTLIKAEVLQTIEHNIVPNTLVLESLEPFPGYHGKNLPSEAKPESLYLVLSKQHDIEEIFRISQSLCSYFKLQLDACPGELILHNNHFACLRLRGLQSYSKIADIQECYMDAGLAYIKKRDIQDTVLIKLNKVFQMERMAEHFYKDIEDELTFYIDVPFHFSWNLFREITLNVKNNLDNRNFDAALGFVYQKNIIDLVRLYTKNPDIDRLQNIREKYLEEIHRLQTL